MSENKSTYCPVCKGPRFGAFCFRCGGPTIPATLECPHCKEQVSVISNFCSECGKPIQEQVKNFMAKELQRKPVQQVPGPEGAR